MWSYSFRKNLFPVKKLKWALHGNKFDWRIALQKCWRKRKNGRLYLCRRRLVFKNCLNEQKNLKNVGKSKWKLKGKHMSARILAKMSSYLVIWQFKIQRKDCLLYLPPGGAVYGFRTFLYWPEFTYFGQGIEVSFRHPSKLKKF